jgi:hypothetical protein
MKRFSLALLFTFAFFFPFLGNAQEAFAKTPIPNDHPILGTWYRWISEHKCVETHTFYASGLVKVSGGKEINENEFQIGEPETPTEQFYRYAWKIKSTNGEVDCEGNRSKPGFMWTEYVFLAEDVMMSCDKANLSECDLIRPFSRKKPPISP